MRLCGQRPLLQHRRFSIWDFVDGVAMRARRLKLIGDPRPLSRRSGAHAARGAPRKARFPSKPAPEEPIRTRVFIDGVRPHACSMSA